jgi:hypothetical protein
VESFACNKSKDCYQHRDQGDLKEKFVIAPQNAVMKKYTNRSSPARVARAPAVAPAVRGDVAVVSHFEYPVLLNAVRLRAEKQKLPIVCLYQDANLSVSKVGGCYYVGKLHDGVQLKTLKYEVPAAESSSDDEDDEE